VLLLLFFFHRFRLPSDLMLDVGTATGRPAALRRGTYASVREHLADIHIVGSIIGEIVEDQLFAWKDLPVCEETNMIVEEAVSVNDRRHRVHVGHTRVIEVTGLVAHLSGRDDELLVHVQSIASHARVRHLEVVDPRASPHSLLVDLSDVLRDEATLVDLAHRPHSPSLNDRLAEDTQHMLTTALYRSILAFSLLAGAVLRTFEMHTIFQFAGILNRFHFELSLVLVDINGIRYSAAVLVLRTTQLRVALGACGIALHVLQLVIILDEVLDERRVHEVDHEFQLPEGLEVVRFIRPVFDVEWEDPHGHRYTPIATRVLGDRCDR
ncbi:hypothetical protein PENTCL1PPCAC_21881, partial [Pristionchus entomophagus]